MSALYQTSTMVPAPIDVTLCPVMIAPYSRADRSILIAPAAYSRPLTWMPDNCTGTLAPSDCVPSEDGLRTGSDFPAARGLSAI